MRTGLQQAVSFLVFFILLFVTAAASAEMIDPADLMNFFEQEHRPSPPLLPAGIAVRAVFEPGQGSEVGSVQILKGTVLVIHQGGNDAFKLEENCPVFEGDTIITEKGGRVTLLLQDSSALTLTPYSKLLIDKALYSSGKRDTIIQLLLGRMRALISKMNDDSSFTVKTPTAIAGVRGTDFALAVGPVPNSPDWLMTALVTGGGRSTVQFSGPTGVPFALVPPMSLASSVANKIIYKPFRICSAALKLMRRIAPELEQGDCCLGKPECRQSAFRFPLWKKKKDKKQQDDLQPVRNHN